VTSAVPAASSRYLTFVVNAQLYALPASEVVEVIRLPALARVPQGPAALLGVANLRGAVLPVASLRALLGNPAQHDATAVAIVLDVGAPVAIVVDAVARLEVTDAAHTGQSADAAAAATEPGLLGAFAVAGTQQVARILDIRALLDAAFARRNQARAIDQVRSTGARDQPGPLAQGAAELLVTFDVAGQEFALPLAAVQEILPAPAAVTTVARADTAVLGITAVRDRLLPLLSLRALLGFPPAASADDLRKVVVLKVGGSQVGLVADRARAIIAADAGLVDPVPPVLAARTGGESRIHAVYRGDGGRRLVSILSPEQLFRDEVMQRLAEHHRPEEAASTPAVADAGEEVIFLVFRLGGDEFGLPISSVVEVAQMPGQVTRVPRTPKFLEGVTNLRGEVLAIVDQRRRFDMPPLEDAAARRLVVVTTNRHRAGLIVDEVIEVLRTTTARIEPPPELTDATSRLIHGVLNLEKAQRMVLLLDPAELLTRAEQGLLDTFEASRKKATA